MVVVGTCHYLRGIPAVIHAIGMGRKAAASIDRHLGGNGEIDQPLDDLPRPSAWLAMKQEVVQEVPDRAGVIQLLNEKKEVLQISGSPSLRRALLEHMTAGQASYFLFEEEEMYTQRESELLQTYLSRHGKLPPGNDLPEDLF